MSTRKTLFGYTKQGDAVHAYELENSHGMRLRLLDLGCTIQSLCVPDQTGTVIPVVLGYPTVAAYENGQLQMGALVGRCVNRIKDARFTIDSCTYQLEANENGNHLHGVYPKRIFAVETSDQSVTFTRVSPDGEEGYPGALHVQVRYALDEANRLTIDYDAWSDRDTILNLTTHAYFNLAGSSEETIESHYLQIHADAFTVCDETNCPTGELVPLENTPLDFRDWKRLGEDLHAACFGMDRARGYDHNFVLTGQGMRQVAQLWHPGSGIRLVICSTQPGLQLYTGNDLAMDGIYPDYAGVALEAQHFPASPSNPNFPSIILRTGEQYHHRTIYEFSNTTPGELIEK